MNTLNVSLKITGLLFFIFLSLGSATDQERLANRQSTCANSYGYQYGSSAMAQCVERSARESNQALNRMSACLQAYTFGSIGYNLCINR